jgi:hypothetical protein
MLGWQDGRMSEPGTTWAAEGYGLEGLVGRTDLPNFETYLNESVLA